MDLTVKKITKWLLVFLAIFIPLREVIALYTVSYIKFIPDILVYLLLALVVIKNKFKLNLKIYDILYLLFLVFGLITSLLNSTSLVAYALQVRSITTMYLLFYILRNVKLDIKDYKPFVIALFSTLALITSIAIIEYVSNKTLCFPLKWSESITYRSNFARTYSLLNNPNIFASFLFFSIFLAYFMENNKFIKIPKVLYLLAFIGIFISVSRSVLLVLIGFFIYILINSIINKNIKDFIIKIILVVIAFLISFGLNIAKNKVIDYLDKKSTDVTIIIPDSSDEEKVTILDRWKEFENGKTLDNSKTDGRVYRIKLGFEIFKDNKVYGTGFGTFGSAASKMVTPDLYADYDIEPGFYSDNEYIKIVVETGIIGTVLYSLFIISLLVSFINNHYKLVMMLSFLFLGLFFNIFEVQVICMIVFISLSIFELKKSELK